MRGMSFKIKPLVEIDEVYNLLGRGSTKFTPVYDAMGTLTSGQVLPVECESVKEAMSLQYGVLSKNARNEQKFRAQRRKLIVYISRVEKP